MLSVSSFIPKTTDPCPPLSTAAPFSTSNCVALCNATKEPTYSTCRLSLLSRTNGFPSRCLFKRSNLTAVGAYEARATIPVLWEVSCSSSVVDPLALVRWLQLSSTTKEVKILHAIFLKWFSGFDCYVNNSLITVYSRLKLLLYARKVFDRIPERNVVAWTAMIDGYLSCGCDDEALTVFKNCMKDNIIGNVKTFVCLLILCRRKLDYQLGRQVHACVLKRNDINLVVDSAVIYFYAQCGDLPSACNVLDRMSERDVICWTALITACCQQGHGNEALNLFALMLDDGIMPNEFTVCSALKACGEEKQLHFGRQLHAAVVKKVCKEDCFVGTCLVDMYAKCGQISDSRQIFDGMKSINFVSWTSMIAGYARLGLGEEAITLFRVMKRRKIVSNNLTTVSLLKACGSIRAALIGREIHGHMIKNSFQNGYLDSTLVWFYCKCGNIPAASKILHQMPLRNAISWTAIISGCADLGHESEALDFMRAMIEEGVKPNSFTCSSALRACAQLESVVEGQWIHSLANKNRSISNTYVGSALIHMYAKCGYVSEAQLVFDSMQERNVVSWRTLILGYVRNGLYQEALKLIYRMRTESIELDDYTLATVLNGCGTVELG